MVFLGFFGDSFAGRIVKILRLIDSDIYVIIDDFWLEDICMPSGLSLEFLYCWYVPFHKWEETSRKSTFFVNVESYVFLNIFLWDRRLCR